MAPRVLRLAPVAATLFAAAPAAAPAPLVLEGPRAVVRSSLPHRPAAKRALELMEAALPVFEAHLPVRPVDGDRLILNLLATQDEYLEAARRMKATAFTENRAFTSADTRESYVVVQPRTEPDYLDLVGGLPDLTAHLVLHEAVHQWIYRSDSPNALWWPAWYAEGMAEHVAGLCREPAPGGVRRPGFIRDDADHAVQDLIRGNRLMTLERLLYADPLTVLKKVNLYAQCGSFYRHLAADPPRLAVLHDAIRALGAPPEPEAGAIDRRRVRFARPCAEALARAYGAEEPLEREWRETASRVAPRWFEPIRAAQRCGDEIVCAAFPETNAMLLSTEPVPSATLLLEGEFLLTGIGRREAKIYLAFEQRDDPRFIKLDLGKEGLFSVFSVLPFSDGFWQPGYRNSAKLPADNIPLKEWIPFRVTADRRYIRVTAGTAGNVMNALTPPGYDTIRGSWGVGAYDGVVRFRKLSVNGNRVD